jgi:hypothetical protein
MTRKDYIIIAEALRVSYLSPLATVEGKKAIESTAAELADSLRRDNPRFNFSHFMAVVRGEKELMSRPSRNGIRS